MKVMVAGLFHLGCVTSACLADAGQDVVAYDPDKNLIQDLQNGKLPIFEPGLEDLIKKNKINFTSEPAQAKHAEIVWVTFDTPVDDEDTADIEFVIKEIEKLFSHLQKNTLILISSQLPVGTTRKLQQRCSQLFPDKNITFGCSPENLRLGKAIQVFTKPDRVVVGLQNASDQSKIKQLLSAYTDNFVWMSIESAEMTKHALNAFLATSVVFINEIATLCERVGANASEVEMGLKTEERIGPKAYLKAGNAIAGGTLARDVKYLMQIGEKYNAEVPLFSSLLTSNQAHKKWSCNKLSEILKDIKNKRIAMLGLTYKAGTNTLRRSSAIEICQWLKEQGALLNAHDPSLNELPAEHANYIDLKANLADAIQQADAIVVSTEWPQFTSLDANTIMAHAKQPFVFDAGGFLRKNFKDDKRIQYFSVGSSV